MHIVDNIIGYFNPKYAYQASLYRRATGIITSGNGIHDGAKNSPHYKVALETSVDEDLEDLEDLRGTSRDRYNNNGFYAGVIECATDHVVGNGLQCKASINRRKVKISEKRIIEIENILTDYFDEWADSKIADVTAKDNFYMLQRLAYMTYKIDGDCFSTLPLAEIDKNYKVLQVDLIGSEYIASPKIDFIEGIKVSENKIPLIYSILQADGVTCKEVKAYENNKRNVLHIFKRNRIKQVRGLPFLSPVMRDLEYIHQYMQYELTAAKLSAIFFGSIKTQAKDSAFGDGEVDFLGGSGQKQNKQNTITENSITQLLPGDELVIHEQARNNQNYDKFVMTSLQKVSAKTRIPLEIILAQFVSSYSASRAAMLLMQKFVRPERELFINSFCKPIRNQVLEWAILQGDIKIPEFLEYGKTLFDCVWMGEPMGSVDPQKDIKAKAMAIDYNLGTHEQATLELGNGDFETNVKILEQELAMLENIKKLKQPKEVQQ